jgi:hypothetical protein
VLAKPPKILASDHSFVLNVTHFKYQKIGSVPRGWQRHAGSLIQRTLFLLTIPL